MEYQHLFQRNLGIFTASEQERIRQARILIVGCGGVGGVVATVLARSGGAHFVLMDPESYERSNANRQITCYTGTLGRNKALCTREEILRINPEAQVTAHERALRLEETEEMLQAIDVAVCAADDWPLSLLTLDTARRLGKPAVMAYPIGAFARTCTFLPQSPAPAECLSMPLGLPYEELKEFTERPEVRRLGRYYLRQGAWQEEWFAGWCEGRLPHAQLCTTVWIAASLAALEVLKLVTGKWKPVAAPRYWHITPTEARIKHFGLARRLLSRLTRREWVQRRLPALARRKWLLDLFTWLLR